jgi:seryl-tRNA synthetase
MNSNNFENQIKQWVNIDNKLKELNNQTKQLREQKNELEKKITNYTSSNNLSNSIIQIPGGKLKITNKRISEPITFKYLENSLSNIIKNENQVVTIVNHIRENRETKNVAEIKRFFNN